MIPEEEREKRIKDFLKAYKKASGYNGEHFAITAINGGGCRLLTFRVYDALQEYMADQEPPTEEE